MPSSLLARYLDECRKEHSTGHATDEQSYYGPLRDLLNAVGKTLKPAVRAQFELRNTGAKHPDFGLFASNQFDADGDLRQGRERPERGAGEVKPPSADLETIIQSEQVRTYLDGYGVVLVTNLRAFAVVVQGPFEDEPVVADRFEIAPDDSAFWALTRNPTASVEGAELEAFLERALRYAVPVDRPQHLAETLASYARQARRRLDRLADAPGGLDALDGLREALETTLGASFETERGERFFRATVVQTVFYGVFSAWTLWHREQIENEQRGWKNEDGQPTGETEFLWRYSADYLRVPAIAELFHQLTGPKRKQLGLDDLLDRTERLLARVDRPAFFSRFREAEAIQYFYEPFLEAYDPVLRKELGVWYTPPELVRYMVARVDRALRDDLGIADGLASEGVVVLDPSCGTGAFLVETLRLIRRRLEEDPDQRDRLGSRLRRAATERLFGFEMLTAPFVVAHLQLGLALRDAGVPLADGQRAAVYLTNALTGWEPTPGEGQTRIAREFEQEVEAARHVKRDERVLVVLGNPPYDGHPGLAQDEERALVEAYRTPVSPALPRPSGRGLNDLYIRFYRIAERQIAERTGRGVVCYVSNNSWLDGSSHPAMRERFLEAFDRIAVDNLHGDKYRTGKTTPDGDPDPSVFSTPSNREGIQVGTAVATLVRAGDHADDRPAEVQYRDIWGAAKLDTLAALAAEGTLAGLGLRAPEYQAVHPEPQLGLPLLPRQAAGDYFEWPTLPDLFPHYFAGVQTSRDDALVDIDRDRLAARMRRYFDPQVSDAEIAETDPALISDASRFDATATRRSLLRLGMDAGQIVLYHYRPFDVRWVFWIGETKLLHEKSPEFKQHVFDGNRWLVSQQKPRRDWSPPQVVRDLGSLDVMDRGASFIPFRLAPDLMTAGAYRDNLSDRARRYAEAHGVTAEDLFYHALAVLHAPAYRDENTGALRQDWPRVPLPPDAAALRVSAALGRRVADLLDPHAEVEGVTTGTVRPDLATVARLERADGGQIDERDPDHLAVTARWGYLGSRGQTMPGPGRTIARPKPPGQPAALGLDAADVYLNDGTRWATVPREVWDLKLGGYPVLKKWLSYRDLDVLGRPLTLAEADHFRDTARRLAALLLLGPDLDAAYRVAAHPPDPLADQPMTLVDLRELMELPESETLEFKVAPWGTDNSKLMKWLCALSNGGGGQLVLGVSDDTPPAIEDYQLLLDYNDHLNNWSKTLGRSISGDEVFDEDGRRVLVLTVASRARGEWVEYGGRPWTRSGSSSTAMTTSQMREIALETLKPTTETSPDLTLNDLDPDAIEAYRERVIRKLDTDEKKRRYERMDPLTLLESCGLCEADRAISLAALILLGREHATFQHLPQAEIIVEYRVNPDATKFNAEFSSRHRPLALVLDEIMDFVRPYTTANPIEMQDGPSVVQKPRYSERSVREAILNAVAHRDYTLTRRVEVKLSPIAFEVLSPGPFPAGVTPENAADRRVWRNEALARGLKEAGFIERAGHGIDLMMAAAIHQGQALPEFEEPGQTSVRAVLHGESSETFRQFTQLLPTEEWEQLRPPALRAVDAMRRNLPVTRMEPVGVEKLLSEDIAQRSGDGAYLEPAARFGLSAEVREQIGLGGLKDDLLSTLRMHEPAGMKKAELVEAFPDHNWPHIRHVLNRMRDEGRVELVGKTKAARWHVVAASA